MTRTCQAILRGSAGIIWGAVAIAGLLILGGVPEASAGRPGQKPGGDLMLEADFEVSPGGMLSVDVPDADVLVYKGEGKKVDVEIYLDARNMKRARERYEDMEIRAERTPDGMRIKAGRVRHWNWSWRDIGFTVTVQVTVPEQFNADIETSDGSIYVEHLSGEAALETSDGDIRIDWLEGSLDCHTSDGDIRVEHAVGPADLTTSDGDITVRKLEGPQAFMKTSDGDIEFGELTCDNVEIRTSDGDIDGDRVEAKEIEVRSSDGEIDLREVSAALNASTSDGDIRVTFASFADSRLHSNGGDILIQAPEGLKADLDLRGEDLDLRSKLQFDGHVNDQRAVGSLNGGGPRLKAIAPDGTVILRIRGSR